MGARARQARRGVLRRHVRRRDRAGCRSGVVGEEFIPPTDRGEIYIQLTYPIGTPLATVRDGTFALEQKIVDQQTRHRTNTTVAGAYAASFGGFVTQSNVGQVHIWLKDDRKHSTTTGSRSSSRSRVKTLPQGVSVVVVPATGTGGRQRAADRLPRHRRDRRRSDAVRAAGPRLCCKNVPGATSVNSSGTQLAPEISIEFDREKAQALDVDIGQAAKAAGAAFGGDVATQFETTAGPRTSPSHLSARGSDEHRRAANPCRFARRTARSSTSATSRRFDSTPTAPLITRTDRNTVIHVDANVAASFVALGRAERVLSSACRSLHLPPNIVVRPAPLGQQDFMHQTLVGIGASLILSVMLVFLLMVALYNSYVSPFIIIFSVPVAAIGAIGALVLTHRRSTCSR